MLSIYNTYNEYLKSGKTSPNCIVSYRSTEAGIPVSNAPVRTCASIFLVARSLTKQIEHATLEIKLLVVVRVVV
jgi:glutamate mutase epsilon subunit